MHGFREFQQAQRVRDLRTRATDPARQFFLSNTKIREQLLIGGCLFQRVQLRAVQVLQQGIAQHVHVGGVANHGRNDVETDLFGCAQPTFTHDELILAWFIGQGSNNNGLKHTDFTDAVHEFREVILIEDRSRLRPVGNNVLRVQVSQPCAGHRYQLGGGIRFKEDGAGKEDVHRTGSRSVVLHRNKCTDTAAEAGSFRHYCCSPVRGAPRWAISAAASR